jgi:hypothetical protein
VAVWEAPGATQPTVSEDARSAFSPGRVSLQIAGLGELMPHTLHENGFSLGARVFLQIGGLGEAFVAHRARERLLARVGVRLVR